MLKVYDCSINLFAPEHRKESLGPRENDMMADLKVYANKLGLIFVDNYIEADRIITNTTYTTEIIEHANNKRIPLIKRMDGLFWRTDLIQRNEKLNRAAEQSDAVIFISKFSQDSFKLLYPDSKLKNQCVILNNVDENYFNSTTHRRPQIGLWGSSASNWDRDEKRPDELFRFADLVGSFGEKICLFGKSNIRHEKIINAGYFTDYEKLSRAIAITDAWFNFSFMDAAPKTVLQAIKCGKPVLYANSGGLSELVGDFGIAIKDDQAIKFRDGNFELDFNEIKNSYHRFKEKYGKDLFNKTEQKKYIDTLREYAEIIKLERR